MTIFTTLYAKEFETSYRRAKPHPGSNAVFLCLRTGKAMAGWPEKYNTHLWEILRTVPVAGFNHLAAIDFNGFVDTAIETCYRRKHEKTSPQSSSHLL
jgi:hypothetical protein